MCVQIVHSYIVLLRLIRMIDIMEFVTNRTEVYKAVVREYCCKANRPMRFVVALNTYREAVSVCGSSYPFLKVGKNPTVSMITTKITEYSGS